MRRCRCVDCVTGRAGDQRGAIARQQAASGGSRSGLGDGWWRVVWAHSAVVALVPALVRLAREPTVAPLACERPDALMRANVPYMTVSTAMLHTHSACARTIEVMPLRECSRAVWARV
jgi:hypothetical protein